ncbi:hypothetical protein [Sphingomonas sp. 35-24ZXX]|uniref:hypothetical protein n=1 Tax=Sphingomonas sp. 35-24ZXX TaxID=1545915 RepID=UPI0012E0458F|nr:hypothetical protein [Sphingomonas sp. 35-24ZXX]
MRFLGGFFFIAVPLVFIVVFIFFISGTMELNQLRNKSPQFLLSRLAVESQISQAELGRYKKLAKTSIAYTPMSPVGWNAKLYLDSLETGNVSMTDWQILENFGWRSTVALQNQIMVSAQEAEFDKVVNIADALLRRSDLTVESTKLFNLLEQSFRHRPLVIRKLKQAPPWADDYLSSVESLGTEAAINARRSTMLSLMTSTDVVTRKSLVNVSNKLIEFGMADSGVEMWRAFYSMPKDAINDPSFDLAWKLKSNLTPVSKLEWYFPNGYGYWTDIDTVSGDSVVRINWNGRGAPIFMTQKTSVLPGRYALEIAGIGISSEIIRHFQYRFICDNSIVVFDGVSINTSGVARLTSTSNIDCSNPQFEIIGNVTGSRPVDSSGDFSSRGNVEAVFSGISVIAL